jgi:hypothetical protein
MPYAVLSGSKTIGVVKRKSKKKVDSILAKEYRRKNRVSVLKVSRRKR